MLLGTCSSNGGSRSSHRKANIHPNFWSDSESNRRPHCFTHCETDQFSDCHSYSSSNWRSNKFSDVWSNRKSNRQPNQSTNLETIKLSFYELRSFGLSDRVTNDHTYL